MCHRSIPYLLICLFAIMLSLFSATLWAEDNDREEGEHKQHILVLNSYNQGYAWTDSEVKGIQKVFAERDDIVLRLEYMDTKVINDADYYRMLVDIYARKYKELHIDVIITTDDEALDFMRQFHGRLFPDVPLVFAGINDYSVAKTAGMENFTGINETPDFAENLKLIKQVLPETREIIVISDGLSSSQSLRQEFDTAAKASTLGFTFTYPTHLSLEQTEAYLSQLKSHQAVFYLSFFQDGNGFPYAPSEAIPTLTGASAVPVFGAMDYMMNKGIIGGLLETAEEQGEHAALMVEKILEGVSASSLPIMKHSPHKHKFMFDYQQLGRFGISKADLPQDSILVNEPQTFYYQYKNIIWSMAIIFSILLAYIGALLVNLRHRARTQQGLQNILETSHTLFDVQVQQKFKSTLRESLEKVLPEARDILLMRYKGKQGGFNEEDLAIVDVGQHTVFDDTTKNLIADAITGNRCTYSKHEAVAKLECENSPVNLLYVNGKRPLDKTDQQLFELFAGNVSMSIDNAETYKLSVSLQTAQRIQNAMLPTDFFPASAKFQLDLHAFVDPAKEVGGDLYDFFALDDDNICLLVGDVSGKGVPAAIFMAMAKTVLRTTADIELSPAEILYRANNELSRDNSETMFVTLFLMIYNRKTGQLRYADGGHNSPYLVSTSGEVRMLNTRGGTALGVMEDLPYFDGELLLDKGDGLLVYTDGVTEAANEVDALYGEARLAAFLQAHSKEDSLAMNTALLQNVRCFVGEAAQSDDITSLMVRCLEPIGVDRVE